jgi:hypothetical protein
VVVLAAVLVFAGGVAVAFGVVLAAPAPGAVVAGAVVCFADAVGAACAGRFSAQPLTNPLATATVINSRSVNRGWRSGRDGRRTGNKDEKLERALLISGFPTP